jgi:hypothetical protein
VEDLFRERRQILGNGRPEEMGDRRFTGELSNAGRRLEFGKESKAKQAMRRMDSSAVASNASRRESMRLRAKKGRRGIKQ